MANIDILLGLTPKFTIENVLRGDKLIDEIEVHQEELLLMLSKIKIHFEMVKGVQHAFLNDVDVEKEIRSLNVSDHVSQVAKIKEVRAFLVKQQKKLGEEKGGVMDGRDIGTVVFPGAEVKFFVTANLDVRAQRRFNEMKSKGFNDVSLADIKRNLEERDFVDSHREVSPLIRASDAILLDTSHMSQEEQLAFAYDIVRKEIEK